MQSDPSYFSVGVTCKILYKFILFTHVHSALHTLLGTSRTRQTQVTNASEDGDGDGDGAIKTRCMVI